MPLSTTSETAGNALLIVNSCRERPLFFSPKSVEKAFVQNHGILGLKMSLLSLRKKYMRIPYKVDPFYGYFQNVDASYFTHRVGKRKSQFNVVHRCINDQKFKHTRNIVTSRAEAYKQWIWPRPQDRYMQHYRHSHNM